MEHRRIASRQRAASPVAGPDCASTIVGESPALRNVLDQAARVAALDTTVLLTGESGTGKDLLAQAIHEMSRRRDGPFVTVNCGAIPEELLESELFGHVKGAFTHAVGDRTGRFASADGGTIFLDEVSDMSPRFQVKMLRVLQAGEFQPVGSSKTQRADVRVIAATNQDLQRAVEEGRFRDDLYYRLAVIPLFLPPLRQRREDIPLLVRHFTEKFHKASGKPAAGISSNATALLQGYAWPGNVRELENIVERVLVLGDGQEVRASDLPAELGIGAKPGVEVGTTSDIPFREAVNRFESDLILRALDEHHWNKSAAAESLGIKRTTLIDMIRRKHLETAGSCIQAG